MNRATTSFLRSLTFVFMIVTVLASASVVLAQAWGVGAGSNPESEDRKEPYKIKMSGFLNTKPEEGSIGQVTLGINTFRETYQFDVGSLEAPDYPQLSANTIFRQARKRAVDFNLIGPQDLLSKIGQAEPGTPLAIVGFFYPYNGNLHLESVHIIGMERY